MAFVPCAAGGGLSRDRLTELVNSVDCDDGPIACAMKGWPPPQWQCVLRLGHRGPHQDYRECLFDVDDRQARDGSELLGPVTYTTTAIGVLKR